MQTKLYWVLPSFLLGIPGLNGFYWVLIRFYLILLGFTDVSLLWPSFTGFYLVSRFNRLELGLLVQTKLYWVLLVRVFFLFCCWVLRACGTSLRNGGGTFGCGNGVHGASVVDVVVVDRSTQKEPAAKKETRKRMMNEREEREKKRNEREEKRQREWKKDREKEKRQRSLRSSLANPSNVNSIFYFNRNSMMNGYRNESVLPSFFFLYRFYRVFFSDFIDFFLNLPGTEFLTELSIGNVDWTFFF